MAETSHARPLQQATFYDDEIPVDGFGDDGDIDLDMDQPRDSHDLSLHDGTRDSVVDNMLLSLDQLSGAAVSSDPKTLYSNYVDDDFFLEDNPLPPPKATRHRGHTYASSHSSDFDLHPDDASSRYSSHHSRGKRSNSSNNIIPSSMTRKGSLRGYPGMREKQTGSVFGEYPQTSHSRGGPLKGSKSSASSSIEFGHSGFLGAHRLGLGNKAASFDHGNLTERSRMAAARAETVLDRSRHAYQTFPDYDSAPQPSIPAGPRRLQEQPQSSTTLPLQPSHAPPQAPVQRRRNSIRSTTTNRTLRKNKSQPEQNMRQQAQEFVNASNLRDLPPIPMFQDPPAPSPSVNTRKQRFPSPAPVTAPKEKPGFFRRVFGGSSKNQPQLQDTSNSSISSRVDHSPASSQYRAPDINSAYPQVRPQTTPSNANHIVSQLKSLPRPPQTGAAPPKEALPAPPTLAKKHSSFFRRRKKSVSETSRPPVPLEFRPPPKPEPLPVHASPGHSSLREVMNPYLYEPGSANLNHQDSPSKPAKMANDVPTSGFSPGYKPHKDAVVRTVTPGSRGDENTPPSSRGEQVKAEESLSTSSPKLKLKLRNGRTSLGNPHSDSFVADSSSYDDRSGRATPTLSGEQYASGALDESRLLETRPTFPPFARSVPDEVSERTVPSEDERADLTPQSADTGVSGANMGLGNSAAFQTASEAEDDGWVVATPAMKQQAMVSKTTGDTARVWLRPTSSEENVAKGKVGLLSLPLESARASQQSLGKTSSSEAPLTTPSSVDDDFHSATSLPVVQLEGGESEDMPAIVEPRASHEETPRGADRERALRIFSGDDPVVVKNQAAAILGDNTTESTRIRKAYMGLFDWTGFNILAAMRDLCGKLILKAETQQVDRILMTLSERWCECNPNHGFKATDVVHTLCYSVLLLNTDLHVAEIESRMTRSQFVKNTLPTVVRVCKDTLQEAMEETLRPQSTQFKRGSIPWMNSSEPTSPTAESSAFPAEADEPQENPRARSRLSVKPPIRSGSDGFLSFESASDGNTLVNAPYNGPMKGWEYQIEIVLKEFYNSIRQQRLPLHGAPVLQPEQPSSNGLSVSGLLRRTPSVLSKAPSENTSYRGRPPADFRSVGNRWVSKTRSRPRLYPNSTVASSRTSLDDGSVWSPAGSSSWSRYSFGKTAGTSMSMESLGSHFAHGDYQQAIGFANALSQAIIREEGMTIASGEDFARAAPLLEDETLELAGAPWAKEGILKHKHHLESLDKKARDRNWGECFAVIEKGYMKLFSFSMNSKSARHKKTRPSAGSVVGGGNWMDNAEALDSFLLRQTIASALPPPGYSKTRPHVWALSLPTGAVHLFQVGTPDIVREFVSTANYWSARLSKEPLMGGVSNVEYGWGENVINPALIRQDHAPSSAHGHVPRPSMASSMRSSMDHATGTIKPRLPGDKVTLSDWKPPAQSMMASNLMEVDQLRALTNYVRNVEEDLARHNELRPPMLIAFSPRHHNAAKAMANWEHKSAYLLREIIKFRTYIDSLAAAQVQKDKIYAGRAADASKDLEEIGASSRRTHISTDSDGGIEAPAASDPYLIAA